ncbi:MAG: response regulator [Candidatus Eisenbacteria bacterium]|nr:response regulator [Candidatus Eisenbacteria bacterium]
MSDGQILIIEDDDAIRHLLKFQLEMAGYDVVAAEDGQTGLSTLTDRVPDLIMTDLMMPGMDGHEVCRRVKSHFRTAHVPVVMLTARADLPTRVESLDHGANDYMTKPYDRAEMLLRVRNLINWSQSQREANPLSGLPGNVAIERETTRRMASGEPFLFLYLDIDNFKSFNDVYGYQHGDEAIKLVGNLLVDEVTRHGQPTDFVGHVGGDDFIALTVPESLGQMTSAILDRFDREAQNLYSEPHRVAGYIEIPNRRGEMERFPLMTLTIAAVESQRYQVHHSAQLNDLAVELKRFGKSQKGSVVVHERRGQPTSQARSGTDG